MITVASFDIMPSDVILPEIFDQFTDETSFSDKFARMGFDTKYMVFNMGTMFFVFCYNCSLLALYLPFWLLKSRFRWAKILTFKLQSVLFWRWQIIFVQEAYLDLLISAIINF